MAKKEKQTKQEKNEECVFCRLIEGKIPAERLYDTENKHIFCPVNYD